MKKKDTNRRWEKTPAHWFVKLFRDLYHDTKLMHLGPWAISLYILLTFNSDFRRGVYRHIVMSVMPFRSCEVESEFRTGMGG